MKKLGLIVLLAATVAFVAVATASARGAASESSSATAVHTTAHGGDSGPGHGGDDPADDHGDDHEGDREAGEDIRGNCDEAEHAADAACPGASATATTSDSRSSSGQRARTARVSGKKLLATVGPGFSITLKSATGAAVRTLRPGTYTVVIRDRSAEHNFHLTGRGFDKATGVEAVGTATWRVKVARGIYTYKCDPHAQVMRGSLRVA